MQLCCWRLPSVPTNIHPKMTNVAFCATIMEELELDLYNVEIHNGFLENNKTLPINKTKYIVMNLY